MTVATILLVIAFVLALLDAFRVPSPKVGLLSLAFALFLLALMIGGVRVVGLD